MKVRKMKKQNKKLLDFSLVCERIANNVAARVSKALSLQEELDEYQRVIGDLLVTLCCKNPGQFIEHGTRQEEEIRVIFRKIWELQNENIKLKSTLDDLQRTPGAPEVAPSAEN